MRLTKTQVKTAHTKVLNSRYCRLLQKGERRPKAIALAEAREILWIEDELRVRLIEQLGRDSYPPDRIEKEAPSNYMIALLKSRQKSPPRATEIIHPCSAFVTKKVELEKKTEGKFGFKITITSSIGSTVATRNVKVDSRGQADIMAGKIIEQLGLKKATYKIS